jgi:hypothetical protein
MRSILLALVFVIAASAPGRAAGAPDFVTLDPAPAELAWWGRARFHPFETQVRGIPVQEIRSNWCKASEFRHELFPQDLQDDLNDVEFAVDGSFSGPDAKETALVGAYETCDGEKGGFFLILDRSGQGAPTVRFIAAGAVEHAFAQVNARDQSLWVWYCMECDFGTQYSWDQSKQTFVEVPEEF